MQVGETEIGLMVMPTRTNVKNHVIVTVVIVVVEQVRTVADVSFFWPMQEKRESYGKIFTHIFQNNCRAWQRGS